MIRFVTCLCAIMAAFSGFVLYTKKHETLVLDQAIRRTVEDTRHVQQQTAMLRTQWALLNQPDRLNALARRILPELEQVDPSQFVQLAHLRERLPAIDHRMIAMTPMREQAQRHLAALTSPAAGAAASHPAHDATDGEHRSSHPRDHEGQDDGEQSLERSLALLSGEDGGVLLHRRHHGVESGHRKAHPASGHDHDDQADDDVVWSPTAARQGVRHSRMAGIHPASAPADEQAPLPPPVSLTN